jgi:hypothetical protein
MYIKYFKVRKRSVGYSFSWAEDVCRKANIGFGYAWSDPNCAEQEVTEPAVIDFAFGWKAYDGLVCQKVDRSFTYEWTEPNCAQTGTEPSMEGGFEYELELITE